MSRGEKWLIGLVAVFGGGGFVVLFGLGVWMGVRKAGNDRRAEAVRVAEERAAEKVEAAAAFAAPAAPTVADTAAFTPVFDRLGAALTRGDEAATAAAFDPDRMAEELDRGGGFDKLPGGRGPAFRREVARGIRDALGRTLVANELLRWDRTHVRRVRWSADRKEVVVIVAHRNTAGGEEINLKMRWWLVERAGGWKVYDLEDLDVGSRLSQLMRLVATPEFVADFQANPERFRAAVADVRTAAAALFLRKDAAEAEQALGRCRGVELPAPLAALRELVEGGLRVFRGDPAGALERFAEADRLVPGMPIAKLLRAGAHNQLSQFTEGLDSARAYVAELGPDPIALQQVGAALEGLGRTPEAADAYRQSLDENADEVDSLHGLRRVLPAAGKAEVAGRLAKTGKPVEVYDLVMGQARADRDDAGVRAIAAWLRATHPGDPRVGPDEVRELVAGGKYPEAAGAVRRRLAGVAPGPDRPEVLTAYLYAMAAADRAAEAYAAAPDAHASTAFRVLAENLDDDEFDAPAPDPAEARADQSAALVAAHRARESGDPWLWYFEAAALQTAKKNEEAAKVYADGAARLGDRPGATDADRDAFRFRRVGCLYDLKRGLEAYAEIGPADKTFGQLAWRYDAARDPAGLAALVAAHAERFPTDNVLRYWKAEVHYLKEEYATAAPLFARYRDSARDTESERFSAADRQIRSLLRAGDTRGASAAIDGVGREKVAAPLRAAVAAAGGDVAEVERLMAEQHKAAGGAGWFYYDEDFVRLTAAEPFAGLRKKYPDPRPKPVNPVG